MRLGHVGLSAKEPEALAGFYERFLGLRRMGAAVTAESGAMVFLSTEHSGPPVLQVMSNQRAPHHFAFKVDSLAELRKLYADAPNSGAQLVMSLDHGPTLSFYVRDPEGNACEVYWETGRRSAGANRPIDLAKSEAELLGALDANERESVR